MQIAIKCWENPTSLLYLDFTVMTFASDNFIHLVAVKHPSLIRYYWTKHLGFLVTVKWGKEIDFFSSALSNTSGIKKNTLILMLLTTS